MTKLQFTDWLDILKHVWETKTPERASELCAEKILWYETPFREPLTTKDEVVKEWQDILHHKNILFEYKILIIQDNIGIAKWSATFTRIPSSTTATLEGIFQVFLNEDGKCVEFHQWYNAKEE